MRVRVDRLWCLAALRVLKPNGAQLRPARYQQHVRRTVAVTVGERSLSTAAFCERAVAESALNGCQGASGGYGAHISPSGAQPSLCSGLAN